MSPTTTELKHRRTPSEVTEFSPDDIDLSFPDRKLVGIDGKWYDVTNFVDKHPGGPVIEKFIGKDATAVFHAYGHRDFVLKHRKPVGKYVRRYNPIDVAFEKLERDLRAKGFFETDWTWYVGKVAVVVALFVIAVTLVTCFDAWYCHYLGAVALAFFWQQNGFIMHEFMHSQLFKDFSKDKYGGLFFGTVCFGISAHWWRDEHILHHALTNIVDVPNRFIDPQMWEGTWAQNEKMFALFQTRLQYYAIKIQHFTFVPCVIFVGRLEIVFDSFILQLERRWQEWVGWALHWVWLCTLLSHLPTWREVAIFYAIASSVQGIFHFQLILSHYCKMFAHLHEFHEMSWYRYQVQSNMNIDCPLWQDWYYGGLQFHIEHHLFPTMARNKLRAAAAYVQPLCEEHGIPYDSCCFTTALTKTLSHLKVAGSHFKLDPR
ncbi:PREDICTED: sphingolipid 10-desaturase-like isoform X2 [Priapulus caudatus]|nr:PREDICTED: sphingolipid 10-desaturase-like isoform X2 [Priapulus caudatus]XP_014662647.1 PREDICTED: sphingolipid 10-desaturase-like isoform X2 [Priapulus caudatus]XP_014662648.1 PREDICTED: sphingolipid 10-desaturase-like isoform X2 [Priapulus caudatus]